MKNARLYYEHAIQLWQQAHEQGETSEPTLESERINGSDALSPEEELSNAINQAINFNNLSVIELRQKNYQDASKAAKSALNCIESKLMEQMNRISQIQLKANAAFVENLLVLLVAYFNFGMC